MRNALLGALAGLVLVGGTVAPARAGAQVAG